MSKKVVRQAKELERIHVSEYLDLVYYEGNENSVNPKRKLYTLVANKEIVMPILGDDGNAYSFTVPKGTKGGKVSGRHNLDISPELEVNPIWIEDGSFVINDAVISKGIMCGGSILHSNAKLDCFGIVKGISIGYNISLVCGHSINSPYIISNSYTNTIIELTDIGDIIYIDGIKTLNRFSCAITIFDPKDEDNRKDIIRNQISLYFDNNTLLPGNDWYNNISSKFHGEEFNKYRKDVIEAIYKLAKAYFIISD